MHGSDSEEDNAAAGGGLVGGLEIMQTVGYRQGARFSDSGLKLLAGVVKFLMFVRL